MKSLLVLIVASLVVWGLLLGVAWAVGLDGALRHSGTALGLCLVPAVVTMAIALRASGSAEGRTLAALGGSGIRMFVVLGVGFLLHRQLPAEYPVAFLYWLAVLYLAILGLEVALVVRQTRDADRAKTTTPSDAA